MYSTIDFHVRGVAPLIMHNGQLADQSNEFAKAKKQLTGKRKKTDEGQEEITRLDFLGSLYVDDSQRPVLPGELIEATIINGAKRTKQGKTCRSALFVDGFAPLIYEGPKTPETLLADRRFHYRVGVIINRARIFTTRPIFKTWEVKFTVSYLAEVLNHDEVIEFVAAAGQFAGFGDYRPRFGRFEIVSAT
jgi:hypothetical protein